MTDNIELDMGNAPLLKLFYSDEIQLHLPIESSELYDTTITKKAIITSYYGPAKCSYY
jgi:hypothetical protein